MFVVHPAAWAVRQAHASPRRRCPVRGGGLQEGGVAEHLLHSRNRHLLRDINVGCRVCLAPRVKREQQGETCRPDILETYLKYISPLNSAR